MSFLEKILSYLGILEGFKDDLRGFMGLAVAIASFVEVLRGSGNGEAKKTEAIAKFNEVLAEAKKPGGVELPPFVYSWGPTLFPIALELACAWANGKKPNS